MQLVYPLILCLSMTKLDASGFIIRRIYVMSVTAMKEASLLMNKYMLRCRIQM